MLLFSKNKGSVLILTLLFLFIFTLIMVSDSQDVIINNKMQSAMQHDFAVFERAESGMRQMVLVLQGLSITLPNSTISLKTTAKLIKTDKCGNQTLIIQSIAHDQYDQVILNSRDIFAKVPKHRKCKKILEHQVLWWN